ncbi:MAG: cation diffusion facilitator family transporter, partial [Thermocrinis sp.]|uniref:cation diffusion facilitator family transporter n=1 Tax=Thermocrinis sp. TaxID=2024383 RepID=UPI003BFCC600
GISFTAYMLARKWSRDVSFSFGTWKVEVLGAYTSAVLLSMMAFLVLIEALSKLINRVAVKYEEALLVAFGGLLINLISAFVLSHEEDHKHDVNLKSAYLHVLTDALTSILAIGALLGSKYFGMWYLDPLSGIVGFFVIINWAYGLLKETAWILLDREMRSPIVQRIINSIESDGVSKVQDIHLLRIHHDKYACILTITTTQDLPADDYLKRLEEIENLVHTTVEVVYCADSVDKKI